MINYKNFMIKEVKKGSGKTYYYPYVKTWLGWAGIDGCHERTIFGSAVETESRSRAVYHIKAYMAQKVVSKKFTYFTKLDVMNEEE